MNFEKTELENKMACDTALTFDRLCVERTATPDTVGVTYLESGDVRIRMYLPDVKNLKIIAQLSGELPWKRDEDGVVEAVLPFCESKTGPQTIDVIIDGSTVLYPYLPIYWTGNRPCNFVEVPDKEADYAQIKEVPHGFMSHTVFWSTATNNWERCNIYIPTQYMKDDITEYPVLYLMNGGTDNETSWEYSGRIAYIMDNLLAEGKAKPFLIVMVNAMLRFGGVVSGKRDLGLDHLVTKDCIPFIEKHFRVKTDKWNRAIAGLSMGSYMSCDIAFSHPELFGSLGTFTTCMTTEEKHEIYERPYPAVIQDAEALGRNLKLFFRSTTSLEDHFEWFLDDDALCEKYGIDQLPCYHRIVYKETTSKWNSWRMGLRDFAQLVFQD